MASQDSQPTYVRKIDFNQPITEGIVTGYIAWQLSVYKSRRYRDFNLWEAFVEDFEGFEKSTFDIADRTWVRDLRNHLRANGVFVYKQARLSIATQLCKVLAEDSPHKWTQEEINEQVESDEGFNSILVGPQSYVATSLTPSSQDIKQPIGQPVEQPITQPTAAHRLPNQVPGQQYGRELSTLVKLYTDKQKYGGSADSFDFKLTIFYDLCTKAGIPQTMYPDAFSTMLKDDALDYYYDTVNNKGLSFEDMRKSIQTHFETHEHKQALMTKWNSASLKETIFEHGDGKSLEECLDTLIKQLRDIQRGLPPEYRTEGSLRDRLINACNNVEACVYACLKPSPTLEGLCSDLRSSIVAHKKVHESKQSATGQVFYTDRKYHTPNRPNRLPGRYGKDMRRNGRKQCFICHKEGCWSTKHPQEERSRSIESFRQRFRPGIDRHIRQYIADYEGEEADPCIEDNEGCDDGSQDDIEAMIMDIELDDGDNNDAAEHFMTSYGNVNGYNMLAQLNNQSIRHAITRSAINDDASAFTIGQRYTSDKFYGIMIDTGASNWSTAGYGQYLAYKALKNAQIDESRAGEVNVQFGIGTTLSIGSVTVDTPIGDITFHIVKADTPFLLCLKDMDRLRARFDNLENVLIQGDTRIPVIRCFGHPFMTYQDISSTLVQPYLSDASQLMQCYLTDVELRQLHRRFGHPSARRFIRVLERSGHDADKEAVEKLTQYCHDCQMHGKSPNRFKFVLRDNDAQFNHTIYVDVMYIDSNPLLHVVDEGTRFQAARWLQNMTAQHAWDVLRLCWIDVYIGPPEVITHDAGTNFAAQEFQQYATSMAITTKEVPVEAHHSIGIVERYHAPLRRAYAIIAKELKGKGITKDMILQMAIKAINDTAGPDGIVPTLLVFGTYPRMSELDPPTATITQRAVAIKAAMKELQKLQASRQVADALRQRNGPRTGKLHSLALNSDVLVWRETGQWTGPYKLIGIKGESCQVLMPHGPTTFRTTAVKPYLRKDDAPDDQEHDQAHQDCETTSVDDQERRYPARQRRMPGRYRQYITTPASTSIFLTNRETLDLELSRKLRAEGKITAKGPPFALSRQKELDGLKAKGVFEMTTDYNGRLFKSRFVDEIKGKATAQPFEKSRLVIQAYNDDGKKEILTQSPTIQRVSQRIILCIAASTTPNCKLYLRDVSQAYVQSTTNLNRDIFATPPKEIAHTFPPGTVMRIMKPLYGIPEAGTHWFGTYHRHHCNKLSMVQSTYDPCLLYTEKDKLFGIVGLQTDDTLFVGNEAFAELEEKELSKAQIIAKPIEVLSPDNMLLFNGGKVQQQGETITLAPKKQGDRIELIDIKMPSFRKTYVEQRARGAYIATVCQPEAAFDLSTAAQNRDPSEADVKALNKRLQWQIENKDKGLRFVRLRLDSLKLFVFVDASFANNKDFSSQIGFVITLANEHSEHSAFTITGNVIHWSSVKCKRVTRSVLASELYAMVHGVDIGIAIKATIDNIIRQLAILNPIPLIVCTDSRSLYDCLVKLGTTREKRLMIDIMSLRQSYEQREITEVRWIDGKDNPADSMTKNTPCTALKTLVNTNQLKVKVDGWVERANSKNDDTDQKP